jgi:hypothetical protein
MPLDTVNPPADHAVSSCPFQKLLSSSSSPMESPSLGPFQSPAFEPNARSSYLSEDHVNLPELLEERDGQDEPTLNWNDPISMLLKIGTSRAHVQAEHSEGAKAMLKGELGVEEYIRWLAILWRVYR